MKWVKRCQFLYFAAPYIPLLPFSRYFYPKRPKDHVSFPFVILFSFPLLSFSLHLLLSCSSYSCLFLIQASSCFSFFSSTSSPFFFFIFLLFCLFFLFLLIQVSSCFFLSVSRSLPIPSLPVLPHHFLFVASFSSLILPPHPLPSFFSSSNSCFFFSYLLFHPWLGIDPQNYSFSIFTRILISLPPPPPHNFNLVVLY